MLMKRRVGFMGLFCLYTEDKSKGLTLSLAKKSEEAQRYFPPSQMLRS